MINAQLVCPVKKRKARRLLCLNEEVNRKCCYLIDLKPAASSVAHSRDRLVVRTLRCGRSNPGSNPGPGIFSCFLAFFWLSFFFVFAYFSFWLNSLNSIDSFCLFVWKVIGIRFSFAGYSMWLVRKFVSLSYSPRRKTKTLITRFFSYS